MCPLTQRKGVFFLGGGGDFKFRVLYPQSTIEFNRSARSIAPHKRAREKRERERDKDRLSSTARDRKRGKIVVQKTLPLPLLLLLSLDI